MDPLRRTRSSLRAAWLAAAVLLLGACGPYIPLDKGEETFLDALEADMRARTAKILAPSKGAAKNEFLSVEAKKGATGAFAFARPPCDMWAPFSVSARFGVFDPAKAAGLGDGIFGLEIDARGPTPLEFYGLFAQFTQGGLNVFVSKRGPGDPGASNVGQHFFAETLRVDGFAEHDGANLVFRARRAGTTDTPIVIATIPLAQASPLQPGFGAFNIGDRSTVGFDLLEFDFSGTPPNPASPAHAAVAAAFRASSPVLHAINLLDGGSPDAASAKTSLDDALVRLGAANALIDALPAAKQRSPRDEAASQLAKATVAVTKARDLLAAGGAAKVGAAHSLLRNKAATGLARAIDAILPQDLRDSLPGNH